MILLTFLEGRSERLTYGIQLALLLTPLVVIHPLADTSNWWYLGLVVLLIFLCTGSAALLAVRRCHALGLSGWPSLILIVPVWNLPGLLRLLLLPGTPGQNRWGQAPLPDPRPTILQFNLGRFRLAVSRRVRSGK